MEKIPHSTYGLIGLIILFSFIAPSFLCLSNFSLVLLQSSILLMVSLGMTIVILSEGIDLSLGAVLGLMGVVTTLLCHRGVGIVISILGGLGVACIFGLINGLFISKAKLPPFIVTFGTMGMAQSLALVLSKGSSIPGLPTFIRFTGEGYLASIPVPVWIAGISCIFIYFVLSQTRFGTHVYGIGASEESALLCGINVERCKILIYFLAALLASIGGLITIGRMNSAHPTVGIGMEFDAIAAVIIGGTSLFGGEGGVLRTIIGTLIIGVLRDGLNLMGIPSTWQISIIGVLILFAVVGDSLARRSKG
ncbi:MAG: ABC transporter permease [Candidatus Hydrothermarchaeota archaeon]